MKHLHWFREVKLFDYNPHEELEMLQKEFGKPDNIFLVAKSGETDRIVGVLGIRKGEWRGSSVGIMRGWEPSVPPEMRETGAGEALIGTALDLSGDMNLRKDVYILKYPHDSPETALWHINLYRKCGFTQRGPEGVILLADLGRSQDLSIPVKDFKTVGWDRYTLEELAEFILRAYASTREDRQIHGWDPLVSNRDEILGMLRSFREGKLGSCSECCKVASVDGEPAGLIGSFIRTERYGPRFGVLGPLGVFPEYGRRGIAYSLVMMVHDVLRKHGCRYSLVATPEINTHALKLYRKAGYRPVFNQVNLGKELN